MVLLQISEPGQSPEPHQRRRAVGIDLGTTNSLVATVRSGTPETLTDDDQQPLLPSVVHYSASGDVTVGRSAYAQSSDDPLNTLISVKRFMGRGIEDIKTLGSQLPYEMVAGDGGMPNFKTVAGGISPVAASAEILRVLVERAEQALDGALDGAVITVPAYFDEAQRQATKDAATLAGVKVLRLLNEPTAAAVAYGLDQGGEGVIAVYDLGGGTFDISILKLSHGVFEVLATGGDSALGGDDFDVALVDYLVEQAGLQRPLSASMERQLLSQACQAKEALTDADSCDITLALDSGENWSTSLSRETFDGLIQGLVAKTLRACRRAMRDADVGTDEIIEVVMVGGSTRVPLVRSEVEKYFKRTPLTSIDPDKVVAIGAAIQADILAGNKPDSDMLLLDVIPLSLGLETMGGLVEKIIPRNTTIPVAKAQEFTTFKDGQTAMAVHVLQGERELVDDCRSLARFELRGIPAMTAGAAHIRVTFKVDADGLLEVTAMEKSTGVEASIEVKPSFGLDEAQITSMLKASMTNAKEDMAARMVKEQQVEASRVIESVQSALKDDGELLSEAELAEINQAISELAKISQTDVADDIEAAIENLNDKTATFAERRMDSSIRTALSGHSVDEV